MIIINTADGLILMADALLVPLPQCWFDRHSCKIGLVAYLVNLHYICRVLQDDTGLVWNEMTRLPDTDFVYKAWPAGTKQQAPKLPTKSLVQRAQLEATAAGQLVGLPSL